MLERTTEAARPITLKRIEALEKKLKLSLPPAYKEFLLRFNGGRPHPSHFTLDRGLGEHWEKVHFFFGVDDDTPSCDIEWNHDTFKRRIPDRVLPVADDEFGNCYCMDLRSDPEGPILFWDHELEQKGMVEALKHRIAGSFSEWLAMLTPRA